MHGPSHNSGYLSGVPMIRLVEVGSLYWVAPIFMATNIFIVPDVPLGTQTHEAWACRATPKFS